MGGRQTRTRRDPKRMCRRFETRHSESEKWGTYHPFQCIWFQLVEEVVVNT